MSDQLWSDELVVRAFHCDDKILAEKMIATAKQMRNEYEKLIGDYKKAIEFVEKGRDALARANREHQNRSWMLDRLMDECTNKTNYIATLERQLAEKVTK